MTTQPDLPALAPGDRIHVKRASTWITFADDSGVLVLADVLARGVSIVLTQETIRHNRALLDTIDTEGSAVGRGGFPVDEPIWTEVGGRDWEDERERRHREAMELPEGARRAALAALQRDMPPRSTQRSQDLYGGRLAGNYGDNPIPQGR